MIFKWCDYCRVYGHVTSKCKSERAKAKRKARRERSKRVAAITAAAQAWDGIGPDPLAVPPSGQSGFAR